MTDTPGTHLELQRLEELKSYFVLDTPADRAFDELTSLASQVCKTPISLISLIDDKRQWFKSKIGVDLDETHRNIAFCSHTILQADLLEIENTLHDDRFKKNPLVTEAPNIRFYAGVPLITPNHQRIGTLCVIDTVPKKLDHAQKEIMKALARQAQDQLERIKLRAQAFESAKMKVLGEMSVGIAHEINNPLTLIQGYAARMVKFSENKTLSPEIVTDLSEKIRASVSRISGIMKGLRNFARNGDQDPFDEINILEMIDETLLFSNARIQSTKVKISVTRNPPVKSLKCRRVQISQVLLNLLNNALDAMTQSEKRIKIVVDRTETSIRIQVKNNGPLIPPEIRKNLFQSFYTTKTKGRGTGLGLSISRQIMKEHGGSLFLDEEAPSTVFVMEFPLR